MSKLYDQVVHFIKVAADRENKAGEKLSFEIRLHSDDYAELLEELGFVEDQPLSSPGSWLLDIQFVRSDSLAPGTAELALKEATNEESAEDAPESSEAPA